MKAVLTSAIIATLVLLGLSTARALSSPISGDDMLIKLKVCPQPEFTTPSCNVANCTTHYVKQDVCNSLGGTYGSLEFKCNPKKVSKYIWVDVFEGSKCDTHHQIQAPQLLPCDQCQPGGPIDFQSWTCGEDSLTIQNCLNWNWTKNTCSNCTVWADAKLASCTKLDKIPHLEADLYALVGPEFINWVELNFTAYSRNNCTSSPTFQPQWSLVQPGDCYSQFSTNYSKTTQYGFEISCVDSTHSTQQNVVSSIADLPKDIAVAFHQTFSKKAEDETMRGSIAEAKREATKKRPFIGKL